MRKVITRTISATTVESANVTFKEGVPLATPNPPFAVLGSVDADKALKEVRKLYGETAVVTNIVTIDELYEISVEDFLKYAKKLEPKEAVNAD